MILCIDVGNSNITYGLYKDKELVCAFRAGTKEITCDEILKQDFLMGINQHGIHENDLECAIVDSVVPVIDGLLLKLFEYLKIDYYFVTSNSPLGVTIDIDNPQELGSDILVGAFSAANKYMLPLLVVDMGTATTIALINEKKEIKGCIIYPGLLSSYNNLIKDTSKLVRANVAMPVNVLGKNTIESMQSGMVYGTSCAVNGMINMIKEEYGLNNVNIIITGGISSFMHQYITDSIYDENLILDGLYEIYNLVVKNKGW